MNEFKASEYDKMASEVFAPIYPVIAAQIIEKTGKTTGHCLDIGCCGGYLGLAMAQATALDVCLFDINQEVLAIAKERIRKQGFSHRVHTLWGDVHELPLAEGTVDLVVSRGSFIFWQDQVKAFSEIYRVLAPDGYAYVGGGFGTEELRREIAAKREAKDGNWEESRRQHMARTSPAILWDILKAAKIADFEILTEAGIWVVVHKGRN